MAYSLLGVHWQLALTADPASTSPYLLTYARVNLVPDIPKETYSLCPCSRQAWVVWRLPACDSLGKKRH